MIRAMNLYCMVPSFILYKKDLDPFLMVNRHCSAVALLYPLEEGFRRHQIVAFEEEYKCPPLSSRRRI